MATEQEQAEAMRQMVGAALKQVGSDLEGFQKKAKDASSEGGGLISLNSLITGMTKNLTGPVGLAAAIYSAAKSLESFAVGRVQLQNFSTDVGASVKQINAMSEAMNKAGIDTAEATQSIAKMGRLVSDLRAHGFGSQLGRELLEAGVDAKEIQQLIETSKTDFDKAINDVNAILRRGNEEYRFHMSERVQIAESHLEAMSHTSEELGKRYVSDLDAARKYHEGWNKIALQLSNTWEFINDKLTQTLVGDKGGFKPDPNSLIGRLTGGKSLAQNVGSAASSAADALSNQSLPDWMQNILHPVENKQWPFSGSRGIGDILQHATGAFPPQQATPNSAVNDRFGAWPKEMVDIGRSSDKTLIEMRDSLLRIETGGGGGGGGRLGGAPGTGIPGMPGGPVAPFSFGGGGAPQPGGGGAAPLPGSDPGPFRFTARSGGGSGGITAPAGTPIQRDGMAEVSAPDGRKFKVDANYKDNFQGFINDYYAAGGKFGPDTGTLGHRPGNASGHPIGDAIDVNQVGYGIRSNKGTTLPAAQEDALAAKWGFVSGNQWRRPDTGHFGIRSQQAAKEALIKNGVMPSEAERAVKEHSVKGSWFDDSSTASGASAAKVAGIALPSREGLNKMHEITLPDGRTIQLPQIDVGPAKWTGRGVDFSKPALKQLGFDPTDKAFSVRRAADDRAMLDRTQGTAAAQQQDANMNASIDFKNMPSWVKTAVDDNGKFKNLRVSRSTPQAGKASSTAGDQQPWSYE